MDWKRALTIQIGYFQEPSSDQTRAKITKKRKIENKPTGSKPAKSNQDISRMTKDIKTKHVQ